MPQHSFIVTVDVSDKVNESVKNSLIDIIETWLHNVNFVTKQPEKLIEVSIITKMERPVVQFVPEDMVIISDDNTTKSVLILNNAFIDYVREGIENANTNITRPGIAAIRDFYQYTFNKFTQDGESENTGDSSSIMA